MRSFSAGIHILVQKGNKYLILKRSFNDPEDPGSWDLPGGGIKFNEQPLVAAVREAKEEAGIKVEATKIIALWAMLWRGKWSIESIIQGKYLSGAIKLSVEHIDYQWVSRREMEPIKPKSIHLKTLLKKPFSRWF